ncbi:alpha/beta fold hydrolase [Streptomyces sp. RB6PN25]|uniref:Alpha/beta fold hydrolase n=1 Tax=Streptomyces humicola TaxID=2953240 RepID=A0ABT1PTV6_9ACTN|nr:alpha/beta fold hydrolase [Streptomyces humicola]MCQ4081101.1 alpha/beta fold hydrolase [Streptomyces humicola]
MNIPKQSSTLIPWSAETGNGIACICIPWAGAGAAPFRAWAPALADAADVYGVRLAGRESRQTEPPATALGAVVDELVRELTELGAPRVALFGHCSGALLAFELAHALRRSGSAPEVVHLLVASQLPPRVFQNARVDQDQDLARYVPEEFRREPELLEVLLPILTADMKLVSDYARSADAPLDVPLTVVYGACDDELGGAEVDGWRHETTGPTAFREVVGADHLFSGTAWLELAKTVRAVLT